MLHLSYFREPGWEAAGWAEPEAKPRPAAREAGKKSEGADMERSMRRARAKLRRLALANDFDYFVTLTLDPARIDRYDGAAITRALGRWADNMVRRHGLRYVLVPERHKDGAFHFHGFMAGPGLEAVDSGKSGTGARCTISHNGPLDSPPPSSCMVTTMQLSATAVSTSASRTRSVRWADGTTAAGL